MARNRKNDFWKNFPGKPLTHAELYFFPKWKMAFKTPFAPWELNQYDELNDDRRNIRYRISQVLS